MLDEKDYLGRYWTHREPGRHIENRYRVRRSGLCAVTIDIENHRPRGPHGELRVTCQRGYIRLADNAIIMDGLSMIPIPIELLLEITRSLLGWEDALERVHEGPRGDYVAGSFYPEDFFKS